MAWGIVMTVVTLAGMLGLVIFKVSQQEPYVPSKDLEDIASQAGEQLRAA